MEVYNKPKLWYQDEINFVDQYNKVYTGIDEQLQKQSEAVSKQPTTGEVFEAAFETHNSVASSLVQEPLPQVEPLEGYSPFDTDDTGRSDIDGYETYYESFFDSQNPETTAVIKQRIDRERQNQEILHNGGATGVIASIAAGVSDPINLALIAVPISTEVGVARVAATTAATGLAATGLSELALHGTQEIRTLDESLTNLAATALFDGVLGAAAGLLTKGQKQIVTDQIKDAVYGDSVGAARRPTGFASGAEIVGNKNPINYIAKKMALLTPLGRTLQSNNQNVRRAVQDMVESGIRLEGDYSPTAVESLIKLDWANYATASNKIKALERTFMKETGMDRDAFNIELTTAMRNGDVHGNVHIQNAAGILRTQIDEIWEKAAQARIPGTFIEVEDGVQAYKTDTAASYMTRRYDLNVVRQNPEGFKQAWRDGIIDQRLRNGEKPLQDHELDQVVQDVYEKVTNLYTGDLHFNTGPSGAAMLRQRVDIEDRFLDDYLVKDWDALMHGYFKALSPRIRLAERFGEGEGGFMLEDVIKRIRKSNQGTILNLDNKISAASGKEKQAFQKEKEKLIKTQEGEIRDIEVMRDRLLNVTQEPSWLNPENRGLLSALRGARSWNIVTMLSNVALSSIPDIARVITYNGFGNFAKSFNKSAFTKSIRRRNIPKNEMARVASAFERTASYRIQQISEVEDGVVHTPFDKYMHAGADKVLTYSGFKHWNSMLKTTAGHLIGDKMGRALVKGTDTKTLKMLGLNEDDIRMAKGFAEQYGEDVDGLFNLGLDRWPERELVEKIEAAAVAEADRLIVTPGVGDKPIFMSTEVGRTLLQFKSFMVSATNRMLLPLSQESGIRPWMEVATAMGLGAGVYALKESIAGREISNNPQDILVAAVENTGLAGYALEMMKMTQALTGLDALGREEDAKYYARGPWGTLLGPSAQTATNVWRSIYGGTSAETRAKSLRRLMPMQNHFMLRKAYDKLETEAAKAMGASTGGVNL